MSAFKPVISAYRGLVRKGVGRKAARQAISATIRAARPQPVWLRRGLRRDARNAAAKVKFLAQPRPKSNPIPRKRDSWFMRNWIQGSPPGSATWGGWQQVAGVGAAGAGLAAARRRRKKGR